MSTKQLLCRHHSLGSCSFGTHCMFSHDPARSMPIPDNVCIFYLRSNCLRGDECHKIHCSVADLLEDFGDTDMRATASRNEEEPSSPHKKQRYDRSQNLTCSVCLDVVLEKANRNSRRFGLLSKCSHVFCIECIRTWRKSTQSNKRTCPECRVESIFYMASDFFYDDKDEEKQKMITEYLEARAKEKCKYFNPDTGHCPFGRACLYKHQLASGLVITPGNCRAIQHPSLQPLVDEWTELFQMIEEIGIDIEDYLPLLM